jgi:hypothetical protein
MHYAVVCSLGAALLTFTGGALAQAPDPRPGPSPAEGAAPPARPQPPRAAEGPAPDASAPPPSRALRPRAYGSSGDDEVNFAVPATRRGGFLFGVVLAGQMTGAEGTPTDYDRRGDAYRVSTGTALGTTQAFFLGGALTDWFAFKLGFQQGSASKGGRDLSSSGVLIGVEAWPLFSLGGAFRDVGLLVDFGTGGATIEEAGGGGEIANAGAYSLVRAGLVWDALRLWKINAGPALAFEHTTSETYRQDSLWFGLRTVFYGAP